MLKARHDNLMRSAIEAVGTSFATDELAFLALTSKPEHHFRDRLAFNLFKTLNQEQFLVCREWNRIDLAVLAAPDQTPLLLVELKWMYSMNAWAGRSDYHNAVLKDEAKALQLATPQTSVYTLLLATHPHGPIPAHFWSTMKYASYVNRHLLLAGSAKAIAENAITAASKTFGVHRVCGSGDLEGGAAYGVSASVMWWLIKATARTATVGSL